MTTKTIELFVIAIDPVTTDRLINKEAFDTFDAARSHILDKNKDGRYKYSSGWTNRQDCTIRRYFVCPSMRVPSLTDEWTYSEGKLIKYYNWDKEHSYTGSVW
jgi:hypothetical protein